LTTGPNVRPGEKPPEFPAAARIHDSTGAIFFAQYYFRAFDWGLATNDSYLLRQVSADDCAACGRAIKAVETEALEGRHLEGGRIRIEQASVVTGKFKFESDFVVEVRTTQSAQKAIDRSGRITAQLPASNDDALVFVSWRAARWFVNQVGAPS
jgi:hypothetical protein